MQHTFAPGWGWLGHGRTDAGAAALRTSGRSWLGERAGSLERFSLLRGLSLSLWNVVVGST